MTNGKWSNVVSFDGGKFRARIVYLVTDSSFTWHAEIDVQDKFKSSHKYVVKWKNADGVWVTKATSGKHNGDHKFNDRTLAFNKLAVKVQVGTDSNSHKAVTLEVVTRNAKADTPTGVSARIANDARAEITISGQGYPTRPTTGIVVERATDTPTSYSQVGETISLNATGKYSEVLVDDTIETGHKYFYRAKATNSSGDSSYRDADNVVYTSPNTDSTPDVESTPNGNRITWSVDSVSDIDKDIIQGWYVKRSTNGGAFVTIGTVYASVTQYDYEYIDKTAGVGNSCKYAITAFGKGKESHDTQEGGTEIESKPSRPISVSAYRNSADNIVVNISDNSGNTADTVLIERSIDGGTWELIESQSFPYSQYIDTTALATDTIKYRVRNQNEVGYSEYTESNIVLVRSKPNPPDLLRPINNSVINIAQESIQLVFRHNSTDGSPQLQAKLDYRVNGGEWTEINLTDESQYSLSTDIFSPNDIVEWKVKTKGSYAEFSDFSSTSTFTLLAKPELLITEPYNADVIEELPVNTEWIYNDQSGTLKEMYIDVIRNNLVEKTYSVDVGTGESGTYSYSLAGFLFENNSVYALRFRALSSSGLSATQTVSITIQYEPVSLQGGLLPTIVLDEENGYANISILRDVTPIDPETITDLTGTTWYFNEHIDLLEENFYVLDFIAGGMLFNQIADSYSCDGVYYYYSEDGIKVYDYNDGWVEEKYRKIHITGGQEYYLTSPEIIEWFFNNAMLYVDVTEAYLYRTYKKERALLAEVQEGSGVLDKYAPLNHDYTYELLQLTADGRVSLVQVTVNLSSTFSFIYFGDEIIKMKWNPEFDRSFSRPDRTEKQYSGRKHKVVYDTDAREVSCKYSCVLVDESDYELLEYFMGDGNAQGIWKSVDGDSFYAIFDLDVKTDRLYSKGSQTWNCTLTVKRIEADNE